MKYLMIILNNFETSKLCNSIFESLLFNSGMEIIDCMKMHIFTTIYLWFSVPLLWALYKFDSLVDILDTYDIEQNVLIFLFL